VCSDSASFDLPAAVVAGAIEEAGTAAELALGRAEAGGGRATADSGGRFGSMDALELSTSLGQLRLVLQKLEREIAGVGAAAAKGVTKPGAFFFELMAK
jgi:hypothetical protein